ncbi:uncharacterized protein Tco025E_05396 [Trypanosoma conorhini]|uniref:Uncharacterized protein n=1 Tax=Trypanosoma conorhini TaxID=83891 RepID=A0A422PGH0_9TRYP|nr:uncharacterized protein Tco025E_05396 [Trypanosoma conorhini]RNF16816.1 hypothetical protein Tco025E_05396 [Trypanosoma conorhini]
MDLNPLEADYDLYTVDRTFVLSLFHGFCTAVPAEVRRQLATTEVDAVQHVLILRPRLTSFTHRCNISLRHPAVSMAARLYYNKQRAALEEERGPLGEDMAGNTSLHAGSTAARGSVMGRRYSRRVSLQGPAEFAKPITLQQLARNNWELVASCYDVMLRNSQPRRIATWAIASNEFVNDVICRYWERITVPPGDVELSPRFDLGHKSASVSVSLEGGNATYATRMTASQYVYLHLRIAGVLLPPSSLQAEILDSIILDLRMDATLSQSPAGLSFGRAPELYGNRANEDALAEDSQGLESSSEVSHCPGEDTLAQLTEIAGKSKVASDVNNFNTSLADLPDISFGQFWQSMLELSDNWTSTSHPMEHAAFLMELYCEVFAHEWDDEELALLKALRATTEARQQEDLLSLMDDEERSLYLLSEFNHMMWSIGEYAISGSSYQPSIPILRRPPSAGEVPTAASSLLPGSADKTRGSSRTSWRSEERQGSGLHRDKHRSSYRGSSDSRRRSESRRRSGDDEEIEGDEAEARRKSGRRGRRSRRGGKEGVGAGAGSLDRSEASEEESARRRRRKRHHGGSLEGGGDEGYESEELLEGERRLVGEARSGRERYRRSTSGRDGQRLSQHASGLSRQASGFSASASSRASAGPQLRRASSAGRARRRRSGSARVSRAEEEGEEEEEEEEEEAVEAGGVRRRRRTRGREDAKGHKRDEESESDEFSWGTASSSFYSRPDDELTPKSLAERQQERARRRQEQARRRQERAERQQERLEQRKQREEERRRLSALTPAEEISKRRDEIVRSLQAKGIYISGGILSDEDVLQLSENVFNEELLRRLLEGAGYATGEMKESDFLHILFGEQGPPPAGVSAAARGRVLDALRALPQRRPPETAYARLRRERQEKLLRERARAAAIAAAESQREERGRAREEAERSGSFFSAWLEEAESEGSEFLPVAPPQRPPRGKGEVLPIVQPPPPPEAELFAGLWPPSMRRGARRPTRAGLPPHLGALRGEEVALEVLPHLAREPPEGLHEHSPAQLALFYRDIEPHRPFKGRAPLAQPTSILGGTYHQLSTLRLSRGAGRRGTQDALAPQSSSPPRCAPVKLFSLTTKTSFAEALRESLRRYFDDKEYLENIYGSHAK